MPSPLSCRRPCWLLCLLVFLAFGRITSAQSSLPAAIRTLDDVEGCHIPFTYHPLLDPFPIVQVRINGSNPLLFLVDTGAAQPFTVDVWTAQRLGLKPDPNTPAVDHQGLKLHPVSLADIRLVGTGSEWVQLNIAQCVIADLNVPEGATTGGRIAGIIGAPLLAVATVRFDFAAKRLSLYVKPHPPLRPPGAVVLPVETVSGSDYRPVLTVKAFGGEPVKMLVDTGDHSLKLSAEDAKRFRPVAKAVEKISVWSIRGIAVHDQILLSPLRIGAFTESNVAALVDPKRAGSVLGLDVLARFRLTLDYRNKEMLFERASNYAEQSRLPARASVLAERRKGVNYVREVKRGSAADRAGVKTGDIIAAVDGQQADRLAGPPLGRLLSGLAGTTAHLTLERSGKGRFEIRYERESAFPAAATARVGTGLYAVPDAEGRLIVEGVAPGSPAATMGLRAGDEVVQIDGLAMKGLSLERIAAAVRKPKGTVLVVKVRRGSESIPREVRLEVAELP